MIVDVHTHVFPPEMIRQRERFAAADPAFAEIYADPGARMATADDLLASMDSSGVDVSVAAGFWWRDGALCREHAAYLLDSAAAAGGRIVPFVPLDVAAAGVTETVRAAAAAGARGLGEVRATGSPAVEALRRVSEASGLPLLVHVSEQAGHAYPGKTGGLTAGGLWELVATGGARAIAAHWGGGLPFHALMPEVRRVIEDGRLVFDSAASPLLYDPAVFAASIALAGVEAVLWGSDFPLREQGADRAAVEAALPDPAQRAAVLGGNAARFLGL